jgi:hypothetical protein
VPAGVAAPGCDRCQPTLEVKGRLQSIGAHAGEMAARRALPQ